MSETEVVKYVPAKPAGSRKVLKDLMALPAIMDMFQDGIATSLTPVKMAKMILMAVTKQPKLLDCSQESIFIAAMDSGSLGLDCSGGVLGQGYMIPYKVKGKYQAQFQPGYRGLISLARRSGEISTITAEAIYENDDYTIRYGTNPGIDHKPLLGSGENRGEWIYVYTVAVLVDGGIQFKVMSKQEVYDIRARSQAWNYAHNNPTNTNAQRTPWITDEIDMALKTVIKKQMKYLPLSVENERLMKAIELDNSGIIDYGLSPEDEIHLDTSNMEPPSSGGEKVKARSNPKDNPKTKSDDDPASDQSITLVKKIAEDEGWTPEQLEQLVGGSFDGVTVDTLSKGQVASIETLLKDESAKSAYEVGDNKLDL